MRRWWPVLFLALIPLIPLWRAVFAGEAIGAFDQIRQMAPWNEAAPSRPWDVLQADSALQFYPWRDMVLEAWGKGQMPLWNPYELAGTPLLANSQSGGFYPPHILLGVLHVPTPLAMTLLAWFHLFWAGLGVFVLCRRLGASEVGAVIGGSSFALSAFMIAWTALPSVISTVAWIPWCLVGVHGVAVLRSGGVAGGGEGGGVTALGHCGVAGEAGGGSGVRGVVVLALCVAMMFLAGHLQFAAYGCMAIVLLALGLAFTSGIRWKGLALSGLALVLGAMVAAPQLLPVLRYSEFSHRRNAPTAEGYQAYLGGAIKPFELATLVNPLALGDPTQPAGVQGLEGVSTYWPPLVKQGGNFAESAVWIGPLVFALLFFVPWRDRRVWVFAGLGGVAVLLAMGTALNWPLYHFVPGWSSTGSPGRIVVLFVMAACVLASVGWDGLGASSRKRLFLAAGVAAVLAALGYLVGGALAPAPQEGTGQIVEALLEGARGGRQIAAVIACLLGPWILYLAVEPKLTKHRNVAVAVPAFLAAVCFAFRLVPTAEVPIRTGESSAERIAILNQQWGLLTPAKALLPPNTATWLRRHELGGYDSLLHRDTKAMLDDINGGDSAPPANGNMMFIKPSFNPAKLADAGVTEIWSMQPLQSLGEASAVESGYARYPLPGRGRAYVGPLAADIVAESYQHLVVRAQGPGVLVVKDRMMPGWTAMVDGKGASMSQGLWRQVNLPSGSHSVEFRYTPPGLAIGMGLCFVAVLVCGAMWVVGRMRGA